MANRLGLPQKFFLRPINLEKDTNPTYWRSKISTAESSRKKGERKLNWFKDIIRYLEIYLDFPKMNLPSLNLPENVLNKKLLNTNIAINAVNFGDWANLQFQILYYF